MTAPASPTDAGFSLIEALVAMTVLAVAATGLIRATEAHLDTVAAVEMRAAGGWAADNALAETRLGLTPGPSSLLGHDWQPSVAGRHSDDPAIAALTVSVRSGGVSVTLRGFRDTAAASTAPAAR